MRIRIAVAVCFVLAIARAADAQIGYLWTIDELKAKADLVVIAELRATTDTGTRTDHPQLRPALPVIEMESEFEVLTVLKNDARETAAAGPRLRLKYYRHDPDRWQREHPPQPGLPPKGVVNAGSTLTFTPGQGPYLLFLPKRPTERTSRCRGTRSRPIRCIVCRNPGHEIAIPACRSRRRAPCRRVHLGGADACRSGPRLRDAGRRASSRHDHHRGRDRHGRIVHAAGSGEPDHGAAAVLPRLGHDRADRRLAHPVRGVDAARTLERQVRRRGQRRLGRRRFVPALAEQLRRGYATASTNTGHEAGPALNAAKFAFDKPEQLIDFAYRAHHETALKAKALVEALYGKPAERAYFVGCSSGGYEGLMEAQRFPADYDGIVAGMPANNWTRLMAGDLDATLAVFQDPASHVVGGAGRAAPRRDRRVRCARRRHDGVLEDPRQCKFDPATVVCTANQDAATCLTTPQVDAARRIYHGLKDPNTGAQLYPGLARGQRAVLAAPRSGQPVSDSGVALPLARVRRSELGLEDVQVHRSGRLPGLSQGRGEVRADHERDRPEPGARSASAAASCCSTTAGTIN